MRKCVYAKHPDDIEINKTIYHGSAFQIKDVSNAFSMAASTVGIHCYSLGDITRLSINDIKLIATSYKSWRISANIPDNLPDNFEIYMVREVTKVLYEYGLSLNCNLQKMTFNNSIDYAYYPVDFLHLSEEIKMKLFNKKLYYIGNIMELTYNDLNKILGKSIIELESAIYNSLGNGVLSAFMTNSIKRAEESLIELRSQLTDIQKIKLFTDEILELRSALKREKDRLEAIENEIDNIINCFLDSFDESKEKKDF